MRRITILIITIIMINYIIMGVQATESVPRDLDSRIGNIAEKLSNLENKGGNVTDIIIEVNKAIQLAEKGNYKEANKILDKVEAEINSLEPQVEKQYKINTIKKYTTVSFLLALPLITYYALPRLYLLLWYRSRRKWLVEE